MSQRAPLVVETFKMGDWLAEFRAKGAAEALELGAEAGGFAPELLIESDGVFDPNVMQQRINKLLQGRIDPPLTLNE